MSNERAFLERTAQIEQLAIDHACQIFEDTCSSNVIVIVDNLTRRGADRRYYLRRTPPD